MAIALVVGVLVGLVLLSRRAPGARRGVGVPFGPFLALGGLIALFAGPAIIAAYLHHLT
jgi:leader peptidase (prepilin peptidase)/N-methyltransferase